MVQAMFVKLEFAKLYNNSSSSHQTPSRLRQLLQYIPHLTGGAISYYWHEGATWRYAHLNRQEQLSTPWSSAAALHNDAFTEGQVTRGVSPRFARPGSQVL